MPGVRTKKGINAELALVLVCYLVDCSLQAGAEQNKQTNVIVIVIITAVPQRLSKTNPDQTCLKFVKKMYEHD